MNDLSFIYFKKKKRIRQYGKNTHCYGYRNEGLTLPPNPNEKTKEHI
jgi:hypothetical protein